MAKRLAKRRAPRKPFVSEAAIHMQVAGFLRHAWPADLRHWHTPNGEARDARTGAKLKAMGTLPGVPDFTFILPNGQGAFIELKSQSGDLSDSQIDFMAAVTALGCGYAVCWSVEDVERTLTKWLGLFGRSLNARTHTKGPTVDPAKEPLFAAPDSPQQVGGAEHVQRLEPTV